MSLEMMSKWYVCPECNCAFEPKKNNDNRLCPNCGSTKCSTFFPNTEIFILEGTKTVGYSAFDGCERLKSVTLPKSLERIDSCAFKDCNSLEGIIIPEGVKTIGSSAFMSCGSITQVTFPKSLSSIEDFAFCDCSNLKSVIIPEGVETIGEYAFQGCDKLEYVSFPGSLVSIGDYAFNKSFSKYYTRLLKTVVLPSKLKELGEDAFENSVFGQKIRYFASSNAARELHNKGLKCSIVSSSTGFAVGKEIIDSTLFYRNDPEKTETIPNGIQIIAPAAYWGQNCIESVTIPSSVTEIRDCAFQECKIATIVFQNGSNLKKICSKAFCDYSGCFIDLPLSLVELAPDAFPKDCVISIGGEMPSFREKTDQLNAQREEIETKKGCKAELELQLEVAEKRLRTHLGALPKNLDEIPVIESQIRDVESERRNASYQMFNEQETLKNQITGIRSEINDLKEKRRKTFFLATARKKELDESIQQKNSLINSLNDLINEVSDKSRSKLRQFGLETDSLNSKLEHINAEKQKWEEQRSVLEVNVDEVSEKIKNVANELDSLSTKLARDEKDLDKTHKSWLKKRLKAEKASLLLQLKLPDVQIIPLFQNKTRDNLADEFLLNEAFLSMINDSNESIRVNSLNSFIESKAETLKRIKEINTALGCDENDKISEYEPQESVELKDSYLPERFYTVEEFFGKADCWKALKRSVGGTKPRKSAGSDLPSLFFYAIDFFSVRNNNRCLFISPCCMVIQEPHKPLSVLTYDTIKLTVQNRVEEIEWNNSKSIPEYGELVKESHKYLNIDGSVSKRYKPNPIIKTIRYSTVTVSNKLDSFTFPVKTYSEALEFENAFNSFRREITTGAMGHIYSLFTQSADCSAIVSAAENLKEEEAKQRELDRQRERKEKKRVEEERKKAELAAEEKRKELIRRQKEINEERKKQAAEKAEQQKRTAQIFDDDFKEQQHGADVTSNQDNCQNLPFEVIGNRIVSNNVFKIRLKTLENYNSDSIVAFFTGQSGEIISNKKKVPNSPTPEETVLGFVLNSGIDYTSMNECHLCFESSGEILCKIGFKMNISFYSDF